MTKQFKSNQHIIDEISKIVEPYMKFNMDDIYGDRIGIPYPKIEELSILHFRYDGYNRKNLINKKQESDLINQTKSLGIGTVEILKCTPIGKFMAVTLDEHQRIIYEYNEYLDYKNKNIEKNNNTYQYLEEKVPEEFVGWFLFQKSKLIKQTKLYGF